MSLAYGATFGFLLQKGGVAKYDILMGALLLEDFTVFKVILTAIAVGFACLFVLYRAGLVELHIKPFQYVANISGGLLFGVGFALAGYCPGTEAAAIGQGNYDAIVSAFGMVVGSYFFALAYPRLKFIQSRWDLGEKLIFDYRVKRATKYSETNEESEYSQRKNFSA